MHMSVFDNGIRQAEQDLAHLKRQLLGAAGAALSYEEIGAIMRPAKQRLARLHDARIALKRNGQGTPEVRKRDTAARCF